MRTLLLASVLLTGCNALSTNLVLSADPSLPGAYAPLPAPPAVREKTEADVLAAKVPKMMEETRQRAGADATVTRTGYFSWEVSSPRMTTSCNVVFKRWRCDRELSTAFTEQL